MSVIPALIGWRRPRYYVVALGFFVWVFAARAQEPGDGRLHLVAEADGKTWREFSVEDGKIVVPNTHDGGSVALPPNVQWRVEGDLERNAASFRFSPSYSIGQLASEVTSAETRLEARISTDASEWVSGQMKDSIVVFVWLVDGKPQIVRPIPAIAIGGGHDMANDFFELKPAQVRGQPVLLLLSQNNFSPPKPIFTDEKAERAVELMHFGSMEELEAIVGQMKSPNVTGNAGVTLLHLAAEAGLQPAVDVLLRAGGNPEAIVTPSGARPIVWAAKDMHGDIVLSLLKLAKKGVDEELASAVFQSGDVETLAKLAVLAPKPVEKHLMSLAVAFGRIDLVEAIVARRGRKAIGDIYPVAMRVVIEQGNDRMLDLLVANGLDPRMSDSESPLINTAVEKENEHALAVLLKAGAKASLATDDGTTPLMLAVQHGWEGGVRALLAAHANPRAIGPTGSTALHYAAASGNADMVAMLLQAGAKRDQRDGIDRTPLETALQARSPKVVAALVASSARLDVKQKTFNYALIHALALDQVDLVKWAVADGWSPKKPVLDSFTAKGVAKVFGAEKILKYLEQIAASDGAGAPAIESVPDIPPKLEKGSRPSDSRGWDQPQAAASITVAGLVDEQGRFLLPKLTGSDDPRIARAVLGSVQTWHFTPAQKNGRAVVAQKVMVLDFRAHDNRVFPIGEVDVPPKLKSKGKLDSSQVLKQDIFIANDTDYIHERDVNGNLIPIEVEVDRLLVVPDWQSRTDEFAVASFIVEPNGRVSNAGSSAGSTRAFRSKALAALSRYQFEPGSRSGVPVRTRMTLVLRPDGE